MGPFAALKEFDGSGLLGLLFALEVLVGGFFVASLAKPVSRRRIYRWLASRKGTRLYGHIVGGLLDRIDRALVPPDIGEHPKPTGFWASLDWLIAPARQMPSRPNAWEQTPLAGRCRISPFDWLSPIRS